MAVPDSPFTVVSTGQGTVQQDLFNPFKSRYGRRKEMEGQGVLQGNADSEISVLASVFARLRAFFFLNSCFL